MHIKRQPEEAATVGYVEELFSKGVGTIEWVGRVFGWLVGWQLDRGYVDV